MARLYNLYHPYDPVGHRCVHLHLCSVTRIAVWPDCATLTTQCSGTALLPCGGRQLLLKKQLCWRAPSHAVSRTALQELGSALNQPSCSLCRLEPLAQPAGEVQRSAFIPLFKGGKRIHLAVQASTVLLQHFLLHCAVKVATGEVAASASTWLCRQAGSCTSFLSNGLASFVLELGLPQQQPKGTASIAAVSRLPDAL